MRRRRQNTSEPFNDAWDRVITHLQAARDTHDKLNMPKPIDVGDISEMDDTELADLKSELSQAQSDSIKALQNWESYSRQLQEALDGTLLAISLKAEPDTKKRRRIAEPEISVGSKVAFRVPMVQPPDEQWIQCEVLRVIHEGSKYEIQDPEPDENNHPGRVYRASVKDMILIPSPNANLPPYPAGTQVIAQYPETTAFYRAEVAVSRDKKCWLIFEGEEDAAKETEVERYLVLKPER